MKTFYLLVLTCLSTSTEGWGGGVHPSMVAPRYLPGTHSDSRGLILHGVICLEHAKLINMGGRSLTYHFPICRYIIQARAPTCPHSTQKRRGGNNGQYFCKEMGEEARL